MCNPQKGITMKNFKQCMITIWIDQSLSNSAIFKHIFLENIKKLYKYAETCDDQQ